MKFVTEFYANLMVHKEGDILRSTMEGVTVTITPRALQQILGTMNEGTVFRKDGDEKKTTYDRKLWLPEGYAGDKFSTYWPKVPRVLQFLLAKLILIRRGSPNTASSLHHCILQHWMESKPINWPVLLINFIKNNHHNHGALISVILDAAGINVEDESGGRGKPIWERSITSLVHSQEWDSEKYWKQQEVKKGGKKRPAVKKSGDEEPPTKKAKKAVAKKPPPPPPTPVIDSEDSEDSEDTEDEDNLTLTQALVQKGQSETRRKLVLNAPEKPVAAAGSVSDKIAELRRHLLEG